MSRSPATAPVVTLAIGGLEATAWDEVRVTRDMLSGGSPWAVTVWRTGDERAWSDLRAAARIYAPAEIRIDGALQLRGEVEAVGDGGSRGGGAPLTISGRDFVGAAMSSHVDPRISLRGVTLYDALVRIFRPLGIEVTVGVLADEAREVQAGARPGPVRSARSTTSTTTRHRKHHIDRFRFQPGTTVWQAAQQLCRRHGYLLFGVPTATGLGLVIDKPAYDSPIRYRLHRIRRNGVWDQNLEVGHRKLNGADTPTRTTVYGHSGLAATEDARHRGEVENTALVDHPGVADVITQRVRYIHDRRARTPKLAEHRARRENARAMAEFDVYTATVDGFYSGDLLWTPNSMVAIQDDLAEVSSEWLLTRVDFRRSRGGGHHTELRLVPRDSIVVEPDPEV